MLTTNIDTDLLLYSLRGTMRLRNYSTGYPYFSSQASTKHGHLKSKAGLFPFCFNQARAP